MDLIIIVDRHGLVIRVSPSSMTILGYQPEEMIGRSAADFLYLEDLESTRREMRLLRRGRLMRNFAARYVHKSGRPVTLEWTGVWSEPAQQHFFIGRDITEQKLAEELFRVAVEACPSGMMMTDRSGRIVMVNSEIEQLFGYKRSELLGRPVEILVPKYARSHHVKLRADYAKRPQGLSLAKGRELTAVRKDGSEVPVDIELNTVQIRGGLLVLAVVVDISERKHNERLKDEFVSTVSHELRTPLTSITASLALLSTGSAGPLPKPAANLVGIAHSNGQRLVRLVNDILDIEKIDSGKMTFDVQQVSARTIVEQAIEISRAYADEFGVKVRLEPGSVSGDVRADGDRLAQVISNLLSNAIKFSPSGGEVVVALVERDEVVRITVTDCGPGIPDEFKSRIFDKFAQADAGNARQKGGTGLGLSIVKQIVERLGGEVGFESVRGQGSVFFVDMPRWRPGVDGDDGNVEQGHQILLCEDDPDVAAFLGAKLTGVGFIVHKAATVHDALRQADEVTHAAILVDLNLPDGDGIGLIQQLRSRSRYHDKPILVISGNPERGRDDMRSAALDVLDWLNKPVDIARLVRVLDRSIMRNGHDYPRVLHVEEDPESADVSSIGFDLAWACEFGMF